MPEDLALRALSALSNATRMRVVRWLIESGDAGLRSSELADICGVPRNLMSSHLSVLAAAQLVSTTRCGRNVVYRVVPTTIADLSRHLQAMVHQSSRG